MALELSIRAAGEALQFELYPSCAIPRGMIVENKFYEIWGLLDGARIPDDLTIAVNDKPLDYVTREGRPLFIFETEFYAGDVRLVVIRNGKVLAACDLIVDPDAFKLTHEEYAAMLSDIARSTTLLYRLGSVTIPVTTGLASQASILIALELIRANFDGFERAVSRIADQPARRLRSVVTRVDLLKARRIDDRAISQALRSSASRKATLSETQAAPGLVRAFGGRWIPAISELRREERGDVYENAAILGFIRWLDSRLSRIALGFSIDTLALHPAVSATWVNRIRTWRDRLGGLRKRELFRDISADPILRATSLFRMQPDYASAFSAMSRMRAGYGAGLDVAPAVPIDRTYSLYETWCYIGLLHAAAEAYPQCRADVVALLRGCPSPRTLGTALAEGKAGELELRPGLTMTYQRRFRPSAEADGSRSLVVDAVPDVTLARYDIEGRCVGIVVLDPKYRKGASLLDGIRDMHVYRDAIVDDHGARLTAAAVILAPRPKNMPVAATELPRDYPAAMVARPGHGGFSFAHVLDCAVRALS